ncbi:MAG: acetate--CoA ligase family protein, partial [Anaerolineales bacterium]
MRPDLTPLLNARSVAIVGISQPDRFGGRLYANLTRFGYPGAIYGINPRYATLYDQPCYPSLSALPARPDLAILAVPNERLLSAMEEAAGLGIRAVFIPGSAHSADGQLQLQLTALGQRHNMAVCGPNCMGFHAFAHKLVVSGYPVAPGTPAGAVTFITHSGSVFDAVWQNRRDLHFNYLISSGNEITTTVADYMHFALTDPATRVIGLFIETVRDPQTFVAALRAASERDVPVVALKVGRTEQGAQLALAHSGALAGQDAAYEALFAHYGVQRVRALDEMLDTLELFAARLRPPTRFIASIHDSGGERGLLMDLAQAEGVAFAPIGAETTERLAAALDPGLAPINPVDAWGTGNDYQRIFHDCILALDADPLTGLTVFAVDLYPSDDDWLTYPEVALALQPKLTKPLIFLSNLSASVSERHSQRLREAGIPVLMGTETGVRAIKHLVGYAEFQRERKEWSVERGANDHAPEAEHFRQVLQSASAPLDEFTSGEILRAYGIPVAERKLAHTLEEALQAAETIGYPVALKTAEGQAHKSDIGGVQL